MKTDTCKQAIGLGLEVKGKGERETERERERERDGLMVSSRVLVKTRFIVVIAQMDSWWVHETFLLAGETVPHIPISPLCVPATARSWLSHEPTLLKAFWKVLYF